MVFCYKLTVTTGEVLLVADVAEHMVSGKDTSVAELDCVDTSTEVAKIDCTDTSGSVAELPCKGTSSDFIFGRIGRASVSLVH